MKRSLRSGFTLVELMIVVAIVGFLAYIGLPMYQGYTMRAKVSELLLAASAAKNMISEKARETSSVGGTGVESPVAMGKLSAASVGLLDGVISLKGVDSEFANENVLVTMTPSWNGSSTQVIWSCTVTPSIFETNNCAAD